MTQGFGYQDGQHVRRSFSTASAPLRGRQQLLGLNGLIKSLVGVLRSSREPNTGLAKKTMDHLPPSATNGAITAPRPCTPFGKQKISGVFVCPATNVENACICKLFVPHVSGYESNPSMNSSHEYGSNILQSQLVRHN